MGAKRSLVVGAHVIDSGYAGEVFIDLHNIGQEEQFVSKDDKIAQLILVPVVHFRAQETTGDLYEKPIAISNRGHGSLGSTDQQGGRSFSFKMDNHPMNGMPSGF
tara:strand:+ start:2350 stop:2664 length:315 start_codon:yes stop_codon:yes gene_type:complete